MKKTSRLIFAIIVGSLSSCNLVPDEECNLISGEISPQNLPYDAVQVYRQRVSKGFINVINGDCNVSSLTTELTYNDNIVPEQFDFLESGELCGRVTGDGKSTTEVCKNIKVLKDNVWSIHASPFPGGSNIPENVSRQHVIMNIGGKVYCGFGRNNNWYQFDESSFNWLEKTSIPIVEFSAFGGFSIGDKGYLVGNNSQYFEYDPTADSWTLLGDFPENIAIMLGFGGTTTTVRDFKHPVVGVSSGGKGYFGIGAFQKLYEYDPSLKLWTQKANMTGVSEIGDHVFSFEGKIYIGENIYDISSNTWSIGSDDFNVRHKFGPGFVEMDGKMIGAQNGVTISFNGNELTEIGSNTFLAPQDQVVNGTAIGDLLIFPHFKAFSEANSWIYYKK